MAPTEVDLNQNLKKKRGRKKGSKNRPKDVIMKEKLKRSKSENGEKKIKKQKFISRYGAGGIYGAEFAARRNV